MKSSFLAYNQEKDSTEYSNTQSPAHFPDSLSQDLKASELAALSSTTKSNSIENSLPVVTEGVHYFHKESSPVQETEIANYDRSLSSRTSASSSSFEVRDYPQFDIQKSKVSCLHVSPRVSHKPTVIIVVSSGVTKVW